MILFFKVLMVLLVVLLLQNCCAQNNNNQNMIGKEKLLNLYKEVKMYDYNPRYWIDIQSKNCTYEVLLNDIPLNQYFDKIESSTISIPMNTRILKSGKQKLTIKMFSALDKNQIPESLLNNNSTIDIKISFGEFGKEKAKDYLTVLKYVTPEIKENTPYYETIIYFEAKVPYELKGWNEGVNLSKEDQNKLREEVEAKYNEFIKAYEEKDLNKLIDAYYNREKEIAQSLFFFKKSDSDELVNGLEKDINKSIPFSLEKYNLSIYGAGKVVGLIRNDINYKGLSALFCENDDEYYSYSLLLYRPKAGGPLEVIR
jgi:hypothetical protein